MSADHAASVKIMARLLLALVALLTSSPCLMGEAAQSAEASSKELLCAQGGYCSVGKVGRWSEARGMCGCMVHGEWPEGVFAGGGYCSAGKVGAQLECGVQSGKCGVRSSCIQAHQATYAPNGLAALSHSDCPSLLSSPTPHAP